MNDAYVKKVENKSERQNKKQIIQERRKIQNRGEESGKMQEAALF